MQAVTEEYKDAIKRPHKMHFEFKVYAGINGATLFHSLEHDTTAAYEGEVTVQDAAVRRRLTMNIVDKEGTFIPRDGTEIFAPNGNEIQAWRGIEYSNGRIEKFSLGVFVIHDAEVNDSGQGLTMTITAYDRAKRVQDAGLATDYSPQVGMDFADAIQLLITYGVPNLAFNFNLTGYTVPEVTFEAGTNRWERALKMAEMGNSELFFDHNGICILRRIPRYLLLPPVWSYAEGDEAMILSLNTRRTREETYNHFVVTGEHPKHASVRGEAFDDDERSPTYYRGKYGDVLAPIESSRMVTTDEQANQVAIGKVQKSAGLAERLHFNTLVNAAHEVGDVVEVVRAKSKVNSFYALNQFSIPFTATRAMDMVTRRRL